MTLRLRFSVWSAEPYVIDDEYTSLADAIEAESHTVAGEANSDHLEDPSAETREAFRQDVVRDAMAALQRPGDSWKDPIGVVWTLDEAP